MAYAQAGDIYTADPVTGTRPAVVTGPETRPPPDLLARWHPDRVRAQGDVASDGSGHARRRRADGGRPHPGDAEPIAGINELRLLARWAGDPHLSTRPTGHLNLARCRQAGNVRTLPVGSALALPSRSYRPPDGAEILFVGQQRGREATRSCSSIRPTAPDFGRSSSPTPTCSIAPGGRRMAAQIAYTRGPSTTRSYGAPTPRDIRRTDGPAPAAGRRHRRSRDCRTCWSNDGTRLLVAGCYAIPADPTNCAARQARRWSRPTASSPDVEIDSRRDHTGLDFVRVPVVARRRVDPVDPDRRQGRGAPGCGALGLARRVDRSLCRGQHPAIRPGNASRLELEPGGGLVRRRAIARWPLTAAHPAGRHGFAGGWLAYRREHDPDDALPRANERAQRDRACGSTGRATSSRERYQMSEKFEYFAIRNAPACSTRRRSTSTGSTARTPSASWPASSPATSGPAPSATPSTRPGATTAASSSRTASSCATAADEYLLTAAEPNLAYFAGLVGRLDVAIEDVSRRLGGARRSRARARATSWRRCAPVVADLPYFGADDDEDRQGAGARLADRLHRRPRLRGLGPGRPTRSTSGTRSGTRAAGRGVIPFGMTALYMARIEAGLVLLDVDFHSSRFAWTDADRIDPDRARARLDGPGPGRPTTATFIGRDAIRRELRRQDVALEADRARRRLAATTTGSTTRPA